MPRMTLLEMTQDILNDMDSDEVNDINDTIESLQVAQIIKTTYYEMLANRKWRFAEKLIQLESLNDANLPTYMRVPSDVSELNWLKYNKRRSTDDKDKFEEVYFKDPIEFMDILNGRNENEDNIIQITDPTSGILLKIRNDIPPQFWTSFDDSELVFDSWDSSRESTMASINSQAYVNSEPLWRVENNFIPEMPIDAFPGLLAEAKSVCFITLKQTVNSKAEQQSARQSRWMSRKQWVTNGGVKYPDYGRRSPTTARSVHFDKNGTNDSTKPPPSWQP